jgi:FAD/FMN-containing dehydrogenase
MATPARINRDTSRRLAVIAVRVRDDAHMTWVAAEVESEYALRAWLDAGAPQAAGAYLEYRAAVDREEAAARDLQRLCELTQSSQEQLARSE